MLLFSLWDVRLFIFVAFSTQSICGMLEWIMSVADQCIIAINKEGYAFISVWRVCLYVFNQDISKSYGWIFTKLTVIDHHQNIPLEFDFESTW